MDLYIIQISDKKEPRLKTLEEAKDDIKNQLFLDKEISSYNNLLQELRKNQAITINTELLKNIDLSQTD